MAEKVIMPKLGMAMSEGKVVKWLKDDGEEVKKGEPVVVVMSKKITYKVAAPAEGIVRQIVEPKESRSVGAVIGFILKPGEEMPEVEEVSPLAVGEAPTPGVEKGERPEEPAAKEKEKERRFVPASPAARRRAEEIGVDLTQVEGTGPDGLVTEGDVERFREERAAVRASPLARRIAEEEGLDLTEIEGTGPEGRIVEKDVLRALERLEAPPKAVPFAGMRESIAEQMTHSLRSMAQLTITTRADVTELRRTREALGERWDRKVSYTDLLVKAVAVALREHPVLGAQLDEQAEQILLPEEINIGVAVALEEGLMVPVVHNADRMTLPQISDKIKDLAQRARANELSVDEVSGGVFTVTNLGMYGVDAFTPIIRPPEVAILGVGGIAEELALINGQVAARSKMVLSLTIDHRVVDGAPGAAFLQTVVQLLEHPALIFAAGPSQGEAREA
jgi:pyruvate dehydrogenase E2 component (dihydrolipoamide acetyltransferase)